MLFLCSNIAVMFIEFNVLNPAYAVLEKRWLLEKISAEFSRMDEVLY